MAVPKKCTHMAHMRLLRTTTRVLQNERAGDDARAGMRTRGIYRLACGREHELGVRGETAFWGSGCTDSGLGGCVDGAIGGGGGKDGTTVSCGMDGGGADRGFSNAGDGGSVAKGTLGGTGGAEKALFAVVSVRMASWAAAWMELLSAASRMARLVNCGMGGGGPNGGGPFFAAFQKQVRDRTETAEWAVLRCTSDILGYLGKLSQLGFHRTILATQWALSNIKLQIVPDTYLGGCQNLATFRCPTFWDITRSIPRVIRTI